MRTLVSKHYPQLPIRVDSKIETDLITASLREEFGVKIESNAFEVIYDDYMSIREEDDFIYLDKMPEEKHDYQHKKTEASDNTLSKSLLIEGSGLIETIPPLHFDLTAGKRIMSLNNARQCSSKRNSYEDSPRRMSEEGDASVR